MTGSADHRARAEAAIRAQTEAHEALYQAKERLRVAEECVTCAAEDVARADAGIQALDAAEHLGRCFTYPAEAKVGPYGICVVRVTGDHALIIRVSDYEEPYRGFGPRVELHSRPLAGLFGDIANMEPMEPEAFAAIYASVRDKHQAFMEAPTNDQPQSERQSP